MNFQSDASESIFHAYNSLTEICLQRMLSPWFYTELIYRCSSLYKRQCIVARELRGFIEHLLFDSKTQQACNDEDCREVNGMFLNHIYGYVEQKLFTWNDVRDEANVIIAASFETTSTALYFVCLCLALHPECQHKLYKELIEVFGEKQNVLQFNQVTYEKLQCLHYTEMVINEAMRLFAPVPIVLRSVSHDFVLNNGVTIPSGTQIGIDIFNMQRCKQVWGPDAHCFRPERHLQSPPHPFAFIPFTKGLRMCIGYRYALVLMKIMLTKIFYNFYLHTDTRLDELIIKGTISLKLRDYPRFKLTLR